MPDFDWSAVDPAQLAQMVNDLQAIQDVRTFRKLEVFDPYPKQQEFLEMGATKTERMLRAGNQQGKSETGAYETALHMTGLYPKDWKGRRFTKPIRAWAAGESSVAVRDIQQTKLCGRPGIVAELGTGFIPKHLLLGHTASHGATDAFDTIQVRHGAGTSTLTFKSYEQGRAKFQGEPVDWIWADEEPDGEIYDECMARLLATMGSMIVTYTPLKGRTPLVNRFDRFDPAEAPGRGMVKMTIWDAMGYLPHLMTKEQVEAVIAGFPAHMRQARAYGEPVQGSGAVFTRPEDEFKFDPEALPPPLIKALRKLWGIDFGINHPFAAVLIGWDTESDIIYLLDGFKVAGQSKIQHVPRMRAICAGAPVAWPHDGHIRDKGSGDKLAGQYKNPLPGMPGLRMLPDHAQFEEGGYHTEPGVQEILTRIETDRFKVSYHMTEWFEEYRDYHREKGLLVKLNDDLLSATRVALMDRRNAQLAPMGLGRVGGALSYATAPQGGQEWDIFTGQPIETGPRVISWRGSTPPDPFAGDR